MFSKIYQYIFCSIDSIFYEKETRQIYVLYIISRPGVVGAVLKTASSRIH